MDGKRAQEILNSPSNIEVLYNGELVWLQKTSDDSGKIDVISLDTKKHMNVALEDLKETGKIEPSVTH